MSVLILTPNFHEKNREGLIKMLDYLKLKWKFGSVQDIKDYDVIYCPTFIHFELNCDKKYICGPHFSVFPDLNQLKHFIGPNVTYIMPSQWPIDSWSIAKSFLKMKPFPFPVNTERFINTKSLPEKTKVFIYFKRRKTTELEMVKSLVKNTNYVVFDYVAKYPEEFYLETLRNSKYGIIVDAHESQGFAIEEALSCNVPLLVWNVKSMNQEEGANYDDIPATTISYWNEECGEYFYNAEELESTYAKFLSNLEKYQPRKYILENLSLEKCAERFVKLIE
jgi:hypothetical protein